MNKTRFAMKAFAGTVAATVMVLGSFSAPAEAKKDTGWGVNVTTVEKATSARKDTGWG